MKGLRTKIPLYLHSNNPNIVDESLSFIYENAKSRVCTVPSGIFKSTGILDRLSLQCVPLYYSVFQA